MTRSELRRNGVGLPQALAVVLSVIVVTAPSRAHAQDGLPSAERVRVHTTDPDSTYEGQLLAVYPDTILLRADGEGEMRLERSAVAEIEVARMKRNWVKGLWIGALVGAPVGAVSMGLGFGEECNLLGCVDSGDQAQIGAVFGAFIGGGLGTLIGGLIETEGWEAYVHPGVLGPTGPLGTTTVGIRVSLR